MKSKKAVLEVVLLLQIGIKKNLKIRVQRRQTEINPYVNKGKIASIPKYKDAAVALYSKKYY